MSLPIFISADQAKQVLEIKEFLKDNGADALSLEPSAKGWEADLQEIFSHLHLCWKDSITEADLEGILNSIVSLIVFVQINELPILVKKLCDVYSSLPTDNIRKSHVKLSTLNNLFLGIPDGNSCKYFVYMTLLDCASQLGRVNQVITDTNKVEKWLIDGSVSLEDQQALWRRLYEVHVKQENSEAASGAMIKLLTTYTADSAGKAKEDAIKCIISALIEPKTLTLDHLLLLKPVQFLEGEPIHDLLTIFVSGSLKDFLEFKKNHSTFLKQNSIPEERCMSKMRLLTLMLLAGKNSELSYALLEKELELKSEEIEEFLIDAVSQKAVNLRLDQVEKRVMVTGAIPRSFGRPQWVALQDALLVWHSNLEQVRGSLETMARGTSASPQMSGV